MQHSQRRRRRQAHVSHLTTAWATAQAAAGRQCNRQHTTGNRDNRRRCATDSVADRATHRTVAARPHRGVRWAAAPRAQTARSAADRQSQIGAGTQPHPGTKHQPLRGAGSSNTGAWLAGKLGADAPAELLALAQGTRELWRVRKTEGQARGVPRAVRKVELPGLVLVQFFRFFAR